MADKRTRRVQLLCTCGKKLLVPGSYVGKRLFCPACGRSANVPAPHTVSADISEWYFRLGTVELGPVDAKTLNELAWNGKIARETEVRRGDETNWRPAGTRSLISRWPTEPTSEPPCRGTQETTNVLPAKTIDVSASLPDRTATAAQASTAQRATARVKNRPRTYKEVWNDASLTEQEKLDEIKDTPLEVLYPDDYRRAAQEQRRVIQREPDIDVATIVSYGFGIGVVVLLFGLCSGWFSSKSNDYASDQKSWDRSVERRAEEMRVERYEQMQRDLLEAEAYLRSQ